jgi:hypothetical protein
MGGLVEPILPKHSPLPADLQNAIISNDPYKAYSLGQASGYPLNDLHMYPTQAFLFF